MGYAIDKQQEKLKTNSRLVLPRLGEAKDLTPTEWGPERDCFAPPSKVLESHPFTAEPKGQKEVQTHPN